MAVVEVARVCIVWSVEIELLLDASDDSIDGGNAEVALADCGYALLIVLGDLGGTFGGCPSSRRISEGRYASAGSMQRSLAGITRGARPQGRSKEDALRIDFPVSMSDPSWSSSPSCLRFGSLIIALGVKPPVFVVVGLHRSRGSGEEREFGCVGGRPGIVAMDISYVDHVVRMPKSYVNPLSILELWSFCPTKDQRRYLSVSVASKNHVQDSCDSG